MSSFPALTGFYQLLFLYLEPISTVSPAFLAWIFPGAAWFHSELIPTTGASKPGILDARSTMAIWQLANCYFLLGLISSLVFRAVRDALPHDPVAQEKIVRASLTALAIADCGALIDRTAIRHQGRSIVVESNDTWQCDFYNVSVSRKVIVACGHWPQDVHIGISGKGQGSLSKWQGFL